MKYIDDESLSDFQVPIRIDFTDGTKIGAESAKVVLTMDRSHLKHVAAGSIGQLAEDYVEGLINISGTPRDIAEVAAAFTVNPLQPATPLLKLFRAITSITRHTPKRDAHQIQFHYDVSDDFYKLWLDSRRIYSCAYWAEEDWTLEQAQTAKLEHICRKLKLQAGDHFLDIGFGWGALLLYAVEHYGVQGTGITLSLNQFNYVSEQIKARGLENRVTISMLDYRHLPDNFSYNKIASIGMSEHVGTANLPAYFDKLYDLLAPDGLLLNHCITAASPKNHKLAGGVGEFIEKYIFPGGELQHISKIMEVAANSQLEVLDVENLRPHYAKTLWAWSDALEKSLISATSLVGEKTVRAYRMYLLGSAMNFENNWLSIHQVLMTKDDMLSTYPFNRKYMYE